MQRLRSLARATGVIDGFNPPASLEPVMREILELHICSGECPPLLEDFGDPRVYRSAVMSEHIGDDCLTGQSVSKGKVIRCLLDHQLGDNKLT
jgi:hypothetical protein